MSVVFTQRELDIMAVLWERGPSTVAEVRSALSVDLSHNTVATLLGILESKGHVAHAEEGRAFRYHAVTERDEAGRSAFQRLVETVFGGSAEAMLLHFVRDRRLTRAELERIRSAVDDRLETKGGTARKEGA